MTHVHLPYQTMTHLGGIPIETFLKDYWQKKPLLVRQAFANFHSPLSAEELAGLSLEDDVVSRLIIERENNNWEVEHGPLDEDIYSQLPKTNWSLLIQHADTLDDEVNALLHAFRFVPNWRLDDIMISYAPDKGGVGPHFDYYDVFLLQAGGKRRWRLGQKCDAYSALVPNQPMKILEHFETSEDFIVEPGDLLYVPAQIAHWGEAIGESITYSIGFRAPSDADLLLDFGQEMASFTHEHDRYSDAEGILQEFSGQLTEETLNKIQNTLQKYWKNKANIAHWLGEYATKPNVDDNFNFDENVIDLKNSHTVSLSGYCRCSFYETASHAQCYINGEVWNCSIELARQLSNYDPIVLSQFAGEDRLVLEQIAAKGYLQLV